MVKKIYLVRHCKAAGQEADAPLTHDGEAQAEKLAGFLKEKGAERIISSPFTRAVNSIKPLADQAGLVIETDDRLSERVLSRSPLSDWMEKLRESFNDQDIALEGGESGRGATERAVGLIDDLVRQDEDTVIAVTHGNLLTLILRHFDESYGFEEWQALSNPDVFILTFDKGRATVERAWPE